MGVRLAKLKFKGSLFSVLAAIPYRDRNSLLNSKPKPPTEQGPNLERGDKRLPATNRSKRTDETLLI